MNKQFVNFFLLIFITTVFSLFLFDCGGNWSGIESWSPGMFGGTATLAWDPPTSNVNGTPVNDLAGYTIYYGNSSKNYTNWIDVGNVTSYTIIDLPPGTYYFCLSSYDMKGNESELSNEMSKFIE